MTTQPPAGGGQARPRVGGRYELGGLLGRGGMAEVREGHDLRLGRTVAIKRLRSDLASDSTFQARFRREAQSAASLNHPAIVAVYDTGEEDPTDGSVTPIPYIVMEYVEGRTLRDILREGRKILPERALEITGDVLAALDYSHRAGIVHRDIKPANVMIVPDLAGPGGERVKVLDFGIAKLASSAVHTRAGQIMGTVNHMSPEQIRTSAQVDGQSDVYSLGTVLFYCIAGKPPFSAKNNDLLVLTMHLNYPAPAIDKLVPEISPELARLIMRMLSKAPAERPTMAEVAEQLQKLDPAGSSQGLRRPSRASLKALQALAPLPSSPQQPQTLPSMYVESLPNSTLAHGTGQRINPPASWRRALPLVFGVIVISGIVSTVAIVRSTSQSAQRAAAQRAPQPVSVEPTPPAAPAPAAETADETAADEAAKAKNIRLEKSHKMLSSQKPRKKNAPPQGKTTPVIR
jgi:serine/threonine protein kinase